MSQIPQVPGRGACRHLVAVAATEGHKLTSVFPTCYPAPKGAEISHSSHAAQMAKYDKMRKARVLLSTRVS